VEHAAPARSRLLLIDDDRDTRDVLEIELCSFGYEVRTAATCEEGLAIASEWRPSIVLCDVGMPGMDGYECARRLRKLGIDPLKLVALTGYGTAENRDQAYTAGFDVHVLKGTARFLEELERAVPRLVKAMRAGG
jgi:two-component system, OmpR family, response regulator